MMVLPHQLASIQAFTTFDCSVAGNNIMGVQLKMAAWMLAMVQCQFIQLKTAQS